MKKKLLISALLLMVFAASAEAEIIPAFGIGQLGYESVVLCQSLTVRESWSASSKPVRTLKAGDVFSTTNYTDGWLDCFPSENGGRAGWVKADYVIVDPAWYRTDDATAVYAWNSESAYQVALLDRGDRYPILKTEGEWLCIGLRGAAGWIHDPQGAVQARDAAVYPAQMEYVVQAQLNAPDGTSYSLTDPAALAQLGALLSHCHVQFPSGCPFDADLILTLADGRAVTLMMATDSCNIFRMEENGACYQYGDNLPHEADSSSDAASAFWALFGLNSSDFYK